ncbi:Hypothetical predicted protein [Paramuricea clavata]|uniref:Uncharacterized protein n=1 Tax=Paramuricea clavata TaxID=317549 RepID=A0A6S7K547_PARCT|nr:Hypothetical predicted protein [Paramuricea clavata]
MPPKRKRKAEPVSINKDKPATKKRRKTRKKCPSKVDSFTEADRDVDYKQILLSTMRDEGYDGTHFISQLEIGVEDRLKKRGKPPRMVRYFFYCGWAHALIKNGVGPDNSEYAFPREVLQFLRYIAPGDIKGEIREDAYTVQMDDFCETLKLPKL